MPFYKWIIETKNRSDLKTLKCSGDEVDLSAVANKRMVNVLQHLSQLVKIASEIFDGVDQECRSILKRTDVLRIKIQKCQEVVENLSENPIQHPGRSVFNTVVKDTVRRVTKHLESDNIFSGQGVWESLGRPPAVDRLRKHLLPPDGSPASLPVISVKDQKTFSTDMTSQVKLPSNVVPIDVSGQQFSRMSTFRRSLIHVDFFIRRKKKREKRRNTVTECDTKELENVLHNIINESGQHVLMSNLGNKEKIAMNTDKNLTDKINITDKLEEKNNNSEKVFMDHNMDLYFNPDNLEQKQKSFALHNEDVKLDLNSHKPTVETTKLFSMSRRKSKGHIPISTISAAMSVAVEMRQMNGKIKLDNLQSSGNSSCDNSDDISTNEERKGRDVFSDIKNFKRNRLKDVLPESKCCIEVFRDQKEAQISNDKLSTVKVTNKNGYLNTLAEQDVFFLSSDESEGESLEVFKNNYGSSLSLSSMSNESLNSLLSQTATEVTSSNITLSSIGIEPFSPSIVSNKIIENKEIHKSLDKVNTSLGNGSLPVSKVDITKPSKKEKPKKTHKSQKPDKIEGNKNSLENSKSLFSSLVNKKLKPKDPNKHKSVEIGPSYNQNPPLINMYGCSSPKISKQIPSFIKENVSPLTENPRKCMQSFITYQSFQDKAIEQEHTQVTYEYPKICKTEIRENEQISPYPPNSIAPEVPLKYSHKVTVTPISRKNTSKANKWRDESLSDNEEVRKHLLEPNTDKKLNRLPYYTEKCCAPNSYQSCNHPTYQTGTKLAARVVLDPEGRVIYCTNSLDRKPITARVGRHSNHTNYHLQTDSANHGEILKGNNPLILTNSMTQNENIIQNSIKKVQENNGFHTDQVTKNNGFTQMERYQPSSGHSQTSIYPQTHSFHPYPPSVTHNGKEMTSFELSNKQLNPSVHTSTSSKNAHPSFIGSSSSMIHPDPNVSGLPSTDKILRNPTNLHSLQKTTSTSSINNSCRNSCSFSSNDLKTEQSNMSMDDLFAVIHNCKKRLNIKSDSEISLESSSSRSSSSSFRPTPTKGALAETGFLSPRSPTSNFDTSRDRRSWADFRPLSCSTPNNRKSLASDRLGPPKPTSMHDFKMLLLQARSNNQANGPRKSAVEMLRVSTAQEKSSVPTPNSPPSRLNSFSTANSPSELFIHDGHTTVPFKRNNRARSSLQSRYTMYPPIFEDCSEDYEHTRDNIQSNSLKQYSKSDLNDNPKHPSDMNKDNCKTLASNSRNWI